MDEKEGEFETLTLLENLFFTFITQTNHYYFNERNTSQKFRFQVLLYYTANGDDTNYIQIRTA